MMKTEGVDVVCTGGTGTIGQFLPETVHRLLTRLERGVEERIAEMQGLPRIPDSFLHLAAMTSVVDAENEPARARFINVDGSVKWLEAAAKIGCKRFIYVSTGHVFSPSPKCELFKTDHPIDATAVYGRSKAEGEVELRKASKGLEIDMVIVRIFSVISPKMRPGFLYPELLRRVREKNFSPVQGYRNVRDFIDAEEAAGLLTKLATAKSLSREIYHIGSGHTRSVRELAEDVMKLNGVDNETVEKMFPPENDEPANYLIPELTPTEEFQ